MKPTPLPRYRVPSYPRRAAVLADPDLLRRHVPPAWRATREMAGATALFLAAGLAARGEDAKGAPAGAVIAPLFDHGEGRGAEGCVVVSPPVFLSEEEAMAVVAGEMQKRGVPLAGRNVDVDGVLVSPRDRIVSEDVPGDPGRIVADPGAAKTWNADGVDASRRIVVEFLSQSDYRELGGVTGGQARIEKNGKIVGGSRSSVSSYNFKDAAAWLAESARGRGGGRYVGLFYDPMARLRWPAAGDPKEAAFQEKLKSAGEAARVTLWREHFDEQARIAKEESLRLLRAQVKDFVEWLKAQGAL